jgi:hypothetical protein
MAGNLGITVSDLINEALGHLGIWTGDPLAAADLQSAYFTLNAIVDGWGADACAIYDTATLSFTTSVGKQSYTIGTANTNDWVAPLLPPDFVRVGVTPAAQTNLEIPVEILTLDQWAAISLKAMQSTIITSMWPDFGSAAHTLNFWPVPSAACTIKLYVPQPVTTFTSTSNTVVLPPGYLEALTFELALKCSSKFGAQIPSWMPAAWSEAKARIKAANVQPLDVRCDPAIVGTGRSGGGSIRFYEGK